MNRSYASALAHELTARLYGVLEELAARRGLCYPGPTGVAEVAAQHESEIVAREAELAALDVFLDADSPQTVLLLTGSPGVGKTTLWQAGVELARERGLRLLTARGSGAEAQLEFAALIDLLESVGPEELAPLAPAQRHALEVALFRVEPTAGPPPAAAIGVAFLNVLRALAARGSLLIAVDDVQWVDSSSAETLAFAARRLDGQPIRFLLAKRARTSSLLEQAYARGRIERLEIGPLSLGATERLLTERLGSSVSRRELGRIADLTLGNPLFALELGRTFRAGGSQQLGDDVRLPETVEELLGTRIAALPDPVRRLVLAVALSDELRASQVAAIAPREALDDAVDAGVVIVEDDRVRAAHPLFATAAKSRARPSEQRELHLALAEIAADADARALHHALAAEDPDDELATEAAAAAAAAASRGARQDAVTLAEHALRLTEREAPDRAERVLTLGEYLLAAGQIERATELLTPERDALPRGSMRARASVLLSGAAVTTNDEILGHLGDALVEAADDMRLRGIVLAELATNEVVARVERISEAEQRAQEAVHLGRHSGADEERDALYALAWTRSLRGRPIDDLYERYHQLSDDPPHLAMSPDRVAAQRDVWRGELEAARALLDRLLALSEERGEQLSYALQRLHLCELELRAAAWDEAARLLDEWERDGELLVWPCYGRCRALLAAGRGLPDETERWAAETIERAQRTGLQWDVLETRRAQGTAALLIRDPARAEESLRTVWEHTEHEGVEDPGVFPVAPDLVEAFVQQGKLTEARAVTERLRELSEQSDHPWGRVSASRSAALLDLAGPNPREEAATDLVKAADAYGALGLRFERARTLLALGRVQRRLRKWSDASNALETAAAEFGELRSAGWEDAARAEQGGPRRRSGTDGDVLTPAERQVAELAAEGFANKEIAGRLFVSVRTVEVHLKRAYAKLEVRSRAQLARRLAER